MWRFTSIMIACITYFIFIYDRLLSYVLLFCNDDCGYIREYAMEAIEECGKQYEKENPSDIIERRQYGVDGIARNSTLDNNDILPHPFTK